MNSFFLKKLKCKKNHTHVRRLGHTSYLLMNFEKPKQSEFWKNQQQQNKNCSRYHYFTRVPKITLIWGTVPEIGKMKKWNFRKKDKESPWKYHHFTQVYQKSWLDDAQFLRYGARQIDGQTGRQKKWHIEVSARPKNICLINIQLSI